LALMEDWLPRGVFGKRPYRGIETVTYVVEGRIDHYDIRVMKARFCQATCNG
jgi:redox-sensitive bicupin YhaK (pirin superfamily)